MTDPSRPERAGADADDLPARRLIAGARGPERRAYRRDPDEPRWFEPLHVRARAEAREASARMVAAGADVLIAPTWLTHRRALLPTGETRRAHDWTTAAIRLAREAVEEGRERRERDAEAATAASERTRDGRDAHGDRAAAAAGERAPSSDDMAAPPTHAVPRHPVLVAGVLPALDLEPEPGVGRLLPRDVASERDHLVQAGLLAEAGADLIIVEGHPSVAQARVAVEAVVETGLPAWVAQPLLAGSVPALPSGESVGAWAEAMTHAGAAVLLLSPAADAALAGALERLHESGVRPDATGLLPTLAPASPDLDTLALAAIRWLEAGAWHLGIGDGATPERIRAMRGALDTVDGVRLAARAEARERWDERVLDAARRAPGGRAAWIGPRRADDAPLPAGFEWTVVPEGGVGALPAGELGLVVGAAVASPGRLASLLEAGGILLAVVGTPAELVSTDLRVLDIDLAVGRPTVLARRDP